MIRLESLLESVKVIIGTILVSLLVLRIHLFTKIKVARRAIR